MKFSFSLSAWMKRGHLDSPEDGCLCQVTSMNTLQNHVCMDEKRVS
jgi:hypothetical protein